jgi:hypothetical protein
MTPVVRLLRIALELLRFELGSVMGRLMPSRSRLQSPQRFCFALARLGTTFIKFGQALSLRRDILPDDYIAALQSLQDHIAPFPAREAIRVGAGFSDIDTGLRLRYEIDRKFAPYIGVVYQGKFGQTANFARQAGESTGDVRFAFGVRVWF